jgi:hypothetical protein
MGHGGLQVFKVDVDSGLTPIGLVEHDTLINRSIRIGDRLIAISDGTVSAHNLLDPTITLGSVEIGAAINLPPAELPMYVAARDEPMDPTWELEAALSTMMHMATPEDVPAETMNRESPGPKAVANDQPRVAKSSWHSGQARKVASSQQFSSRQIDNELVVSLATETAADRESFDFFIGDANLEPDGASGGHLSDVVDLLSQDSMRVPLN